MENPFPFPHAEIKNPQSAIENSAFRNLVELMGIEPTTS